MHGQAVSFAPVQPSSAVHAEVGPPRVVAAMRELVRSGYAVDPDAEGTGLMLRHKVAPDLVLRDDGTIELAVSQPVPRRGRKAVRESGRISWRRTFRVAFVAAIAWSSTVFLGVALLSG